MPGEPLTLFVNGLIRTMDGDRPTARAVAVSDGRFAAVGSNEEILALRSTGLSAAGSARATATEVVDLRGLTVVPGLIESHVHLYWLGQSLAQLDLSDCRSIEEMRRLISRRVEKIPPGAWVLGWGWHQERFRERRDPGLADVDDITPLNPLYLVRSCTHTALVNSAALREAEIRSFTPDPPGGKIVRDPEGRPTGLLHETAMQLVSGRVPEPDERGKAEILLAAMNHVASQGMTTVHSIDSGLWDVFHGIRSSGVMPVRVYLSEPLTSEEEIRLVTRRTGHGDEWLRTGAVKFWADGAFGPRTAALREPYADDPGNTGLLVHEPHVLKRLVTTATRVGRQVMVHALGDRAMDVTLDAIEEAVRIGAKRPRIAHCGLVDQGVLRRMVSLGVVADLQPAFMPHEHEWMPRRMGPSRDAVTYRVRTLMEAGVRCTAGSDAPVHKANPMTGIFGAVARTGFDGRPPGGWNPSERVSAAEALCMFTANGAYAEFAENEKGIIREGFLADMTVLSEDLLKSDPMDIPAVRVMMTVVGGEIRWKASDME
ncbi:MAG: amidohydrolase [Firmicutes bacterium]|jgi:predicted amidohydrolase YtcJ|nr:amidohydrolase [Bacillota bacterium]